MSDIFYIKRNDTSPALEYTLDPVTDLTGATVTFSMTSSAGVLKVTKQPVTINSPASAGVVQRIFVAADTNAAGLFTGEFEVVYGDGSIETFPNKGYLSIIIEADLA